MTCHRMRASAQPAEAGNFSRYLQQDRELVRAYGAPLPFGASEFHSESPAAPRLSGI